jgi:hypothetical protein
MIAHKFRGRLDRESVIREMTAAVTGARAAGAQTIGVNAEDGSRTDDGFLLEFALASLASRCPPTSPVSAATPSPTSRASTPTAR